MELRLTPVYRNRKVVTDKPVINKLVWKRAAKL